MVKALRALPGEQREITLKPWLYRIAHNESVSLLRGRRPDSELDAAAHVGTAGAESIVESRERLRDLTADLQELTDQQRGSLLMRELGGLEFSEVAAALAVSATAAKQSVYEARCALQSMQEGRDMACDLMRRALSDGDKRTLRAMKLRSHLRACGSCRDFQAALDRRPAQLAAIVPPLPLAAGASMLHGILGGAGHGAAGGGLGIGVTAGTKAAGMLSVSAAKVATVAVIAGSVAGAGIYVAPSFTREVAQPASRPAANRLPAASGHDTVVAQRAAERRLAGSAPAPAARKATAGATPSTTGHAPAVPPAQRQAAAAPAAVAARSRPAVAGAHPSAGAKASARSQPARATRRPARPAGTPSAASRPEVVRSAPATVPAPVTPAAPAAARAPVPDAAPVATPPAVAAPVPPRPR